MTVVHGVSVSFGVDGAVKVLFQKAPFELGFHDDGGQVLLITGFSGLSLHGRIFIKAG